MPTKSGKRIQIAINVDKKLLRIFDKLAAKNHRSRNKEIEATIEARVNGAKETPEVCLKCKGWVIKPTTKFYPYCSEQCREADNG